MVKSTDKQLKIYIEKIGKSNHISLDYSLLKCLINILPRNAMSFDNLEEKIFHCELREFCEGGGRGRSDEFKDFENKKGLSNANQKVQTQ